MKWIPCRLLVLLAAILVTATVPATAQAGETYTRVDWRECGSNDSGGQYDQRRTFYVACGTNVLVQTGNVRTKRPLGIAVKDVAPSPDGAHLYVVSAGMLIRFDRRADGSYVRNAGWALGDVTANGWTFRPRVKSAATDAHGNIYASNVPPADNVISKHGPDGQQITAFGGYSTDLTLGTFYVNRGVGVSRDGRYVYVVEKTGGLIERWDYQVDGSYKATQQWGRHVVGGSCRDGEFAAPGDAVVDPWGFVYIMDTTCGRVQKFTAAGAWVWSKSVTAKSHRLAVDSYGSVYAGERARSALMRAAGDAPTAEMPELEPLPQPPYVHGVRDMCPLQEWNNGAGQAARDGTVYVACGRSIYVAESGGAEVGHIALPAGAHYYDVAPSPDEKYLYVTRRVDQQGRAELKRFVRVGDAGLTYRLDDAWRIDDIVLAGTSWTPQGQFVATDAWGDIYFSNGGWSGYYADEWDGEFVWEAAPAIVVKYDPAGRVKTQFGGQELGEFDVNMGITVSRDGRTVYTVETKTARVQRFEYTATGEYRQTVAPISFGQPDATCAAEQGLLTPYDIGVDPWGELWVANTGCRRADKYSADGELIYSVPTGGLLHGVAVDLQGNAWIGQRNAYISRSAQNPVPGPLPALRPLEETDTEGPVIEDVVVPAATTTQLLHFEIRATDARTITGMRLAGEDGNWRAWEAFSAQATFLSSAGYGPKVVYVQLRDDLGNESTVAYRTYRYQAVADVTAPVLHGVTLPDPAQTRDIVVTTVATDDQGIAQMRLANEDGTFGPWVAYATQKPHTLSASASRYKGVYVQLRDAAGNESNILYARTVLAG